MQECCYTISITNEPLSGSRKVNVHRLSFLMIFLTLSRSLYHVHIFAIYKSIKTLFLAIDVVSES